MRRRLTDTILLLYPRRVREGHGPEIVALIDDLIAREGRSHARLIIRLAVDGVLERVASTAALRMVAAALGATTLGGLAVSDLAAARAFRRAPRPVPSGARHALRVPGCAATVPLGRIGKRTRNRLRFDRRSKRNRANASRTVIALTLTPGPFVC